MDAGRRGDRFHKSRGAANRRGARLSLPRGGRMETDALRGPAIWNSLSPWRDTALVSVSGARVRAARCIALWWPGLCLPPLPPPRLSKPTRKRFRPGRTKGWPSQG